jgi:RimJ/RimL family protein N-acetyltransferase
MSVVFTTERLSVRPWTLSGADVAAAFAIFGDPEVTRFLSRREPDLASQRRGLAALNRDSASMPPGMGWWAVERRVDRCAVGCAALKPLEAGGDEIEVGYHLARPHWGQGYATEAALGCLRHGFLTLGLERIVALVDPRNEASLRVIARLGMERAGTAFHHGRERAKFALTSREFAATYPA